MSTPDSSRRHDLSHLSLLARLRASLGAGALDKSGDPDSAREQRRGQVAVSGPRLGAPPPSPELESGAFHHLPVSAGTQR